MDQLNNATVSCYHSRNKTMHLQIRLMSTGLKSTSLWSKMESISDSSILEAEIILVWFFRDGSRIWVVTKNI